VNAGIARSGLTLAAIAAICAALVATSFQLTRHRIAANQQAMLEQSLAPALAGLKFDGKVSESRVVLAPPHGLPGSDDAIVYRVYAGGAPLAALFAVTARDGYAGPIRILVGVSYEGVVTGIRILEHRETPGLGDRIESSRSDWVYQFGGHSLGDPVVGRWKLQTDGGDFDQLSGASVTPRAVLKAIRETLVYFSTHREELFAMSSSEGQQ
jgi:electron transport complex protein RnfG